MTSAPELQTGRVLVVVLDRVRARLFQVTAAGCSEFPCLALPSTRGGRFHSDRRGSPGWGEHEYHGRLREEEHRQVETIVQELLRLDRQPGDQLLIAGPKTAVAALSRALPNELADHLIGTSRLNPTAITEAVVLRAARAAQILQRPITERRLLVAMNEGLGSGRAVNGVQETLATLTKRQVRTLLVPAENLRASWSAPVAQLVEQAIRDAQTQDAAVVTIHEPNVAKEIDVIAALLRWSS